MAFSCLLQQGKDFMPLEMGIPIIRRPRMLPTTRWNSKTFKTEAGAWDAAAACRGIQRIGGTISSTRSPWAIPIMVTAAIPQFWARLWPLLLEANLFPTTTGALAIQVIIRCKAFFSCQSGGQNCNFTEKSHIIFCRESNKTNFFLEMSQYRVNVKWKLVPYCRIRHVTLAQTRSLFSYKQL